MSTELDHHGHSPAAWVAVIIMLAAFAAGAVCFWFEQVVGVWVSVALIFVGWAIGGVLAKLGWGVNGPKYQPKGH
ncbi:MAG: HGxxPAAW family protein [Agromyces sp.]